MSKLKAGSVADFANSLAEAIEQALNAEWQAVKGAALPAQGQDDRRLLFVAIARGVLTYLKTHENELLTSITLESGGIQSSSTVRQLEVNV